MQVSSRLRTQRSPQENQHQPHGRQYAEAREEESFARQHGREADGAHVVMAAIRRGNRLLSMPVIMAPTRAGVWDAARPVHRRPPLAARRAALSKASDAGPRGVSFETSADVSRALGGSGDGRGSDLARTSRVGRGG